MIAVTDADRKAAGELRAILADLSGFWHRPDDDGPLCMALAKHREQVETQLLEKVSSTAVRPPIAETACMPPNARARVKLRTAALAS